MTFSEKTIEGLPVFELDGKIMGGTPEYLALCQRLKKLIAAGHRHLILDFNKVMWINSAGVGFLLECVAGLRRNGGDAYFVGVNGRVAHYFKITKLNTVLKFYDSPDAVVNELLHMAISA